MKVLVTAKLSDAKLRDKLVGLTENPRVAEILLVRRTELRSTAKVRNICPRGLARRSRILFELWRLWTLLRLVRREKPALIFGIQLVLHGVQAAVAGALTRTPSVVWLIGSDVHVHLARPWCRRMLAWSLRATTKIGVMGPRSRERLRSLGVDTTKFVEMQVFVDPSRFVTNERGGTPRWDLVFVGRLAPVKRVDRILHAVAEAAEQLPSISLAIVGDGPLKSDLQRLATELEIDKHVQFVGHSPNVEEHLQAAKLLVMASSSEGVPTAAVEAMCCGKPVTISDVGDVQAVFRHVENAWLVDADDSQALAEGIVRILEDPALYEKLAAESRRAAQDYLQRWSAPGQVQLWDELLPVDEQIPFRSERSAQPRMLQRSRPHSPAEVAKP